MLPSNTKGIKYQKFKLDLTFQGFGNSCFLHFPGREETHPLSLSPLPFKRQAFNIFFLSKVKAKKRKKNLKIEFWVVIIKGFKSDLIISRYMSIRKSISTAWQKEQLRPEAFSSRITQLGVKAPEDMESS